MISVHCLLRSVPAAALVVVLTASLPSSTTAFGVTSTSSRLGFPSFRPVATESSTEATATPKEAAPSASDSEGIASSSSADDPPAPTPHQDPLLIRAAKGLPVERTPVWMMRQAGRHIAEYRELCKTYPTFRERSEIPDVAVEVSLQPWRNYQTDGCILFSDILTPLPGMGCEFVIDEKLGPIMEPLRTYDDVKDRVSH
jgi:uroporphyrinogen decarboxylase